MNIDLYSILLDIHVFTFKLSLPPFVARQLAQNKYHAIFLISGVFLSVLVLNSFSNRFETGRVLLVDGSTSLVKVSSQFEVPFPLSNGGQTFRHSLVLSAYVRYINNHVLF